MILVIAAVALVAFASLAMAGADCGKCPAKSACKAAADCPGYDKASVTTFEAKVVSIDKETCKTCNMTHVDLTVETEAGKVKVRLGPAWFMEKQDEILEQGDVVEILASKVKEGDSDMFVAGKVKKGDEVLMLRDEAGLPVWQGWRRGQV